MREGDLWKGRADGWARTKPRALCIAAAAVAAPGRDRSHRGCQCRQCPGAAAVHADLSFLACWFLDPLLHFWTAARPAAHPHPALCLLQLMWLGGCQHPAL
eukprot:1140892-Pelagomonas_calceolata.AAC.6